MLPYAPLKVNASPCFTPIIPCAQIITVTDYSSTNDQAKRREKLKYMIDRTGASYIGQMEKVGDKAARILIAAG